ncbi:hypothetical protein MB46_05765 [Arthrobacter alpinus]|uniref:MBL fold metallo-hydrolase n=1 Tax=Arthrobacter alpinus TaxID=656366 RepID=UPI0005C93426|nr:MBL fold metallo-hydrolase [Arthrobacter alpinus]ALV45087.1 hypothetical protein MB46_05765 [Arthrobacter alpinus]
MLWAEVASGIFVKRFGSDEMNVIAIVGPTGVTVVDTGGSPAEAHEIVTELKKRFGMPIIGAINTHAHYDHCFGNAVFEAHGVPVMGHHRIPAHFGAFEGPRLDAWRADPALEPDKDWAGVVLTQPSVLIHQSMEFTAGGREINCLPITQGHTDTDLAIHVPDARVWMLGDVIEEAGPPMFGSGSWPLDWATSLEELLLKVCPTDIIVPGHGQVVDREFAIRQARALAAVAKAIRGAWTAGIGIEDALDAVQLPWPQWMLRSAIEQGFSQLAAERPTVEG